jgi:hypothetical protein
MKYFLRYITISLSLSIVVIVCAFIYAIKNLPNPLAFKKTVQEFDQNAKNLNKQTLMENAFAKAGKDGTQKVIAGAAPIKNEKEIDTDKDIFKQLQDEPFSDIRVCDNLGYPSDKLDRNTIGLALMDLRRVDPATESFRIPIKYVFQSDQVRELLSEVENIKDLPETEKQDFLEKSNFYYKASLKVVDFYRHKKDYEDMADRAFHLYVIQQIALKKPELKDDKNILNICKTLESSIGNKDKIDIDAETDYIVKLIEYYGLTPKELGFNPKVKTKFQFEVKNRAVSFGFSHPGMDI